MELEAKYRKFWEPWITRDIVSLVKEKKEAFVKDRSWEHMKQVWNTRKVERNLSKE